MLSLRFFKSENIGTKIIELTNMGATREIEPNFAVFSFKSCLRVC